MQLPIIFQLLYPFHHGDAIFCTIIIGLVVKAKSSSYYSLVLVSLCLDFSTLFVFSHIQISMGGLRSLSSTCKLVISLLTSSCLPYLFSTPLLTHPRISLSIFFLLDLHKATGAYKVYSMLTNSITLSMNSHNVKGVFLANSAMNVLLDHMSPRSAVRVIFSS